VLTQLGVKLVEIGYSNQILPSMGRDLQYAINEHTVAVYYLESGWCAPGALELEEVVAVTKPLDIPVVVDRPPSCRPKKKLALQPARRDETVSARQGPPRPEVQRLIVGEHSLIDIISVLPSPTTAMAG
jgi:L-seryl-tRNA(Ser) seleniumtransferase